MIPQSLHFTTATPLKTCKQLCYQHNTNRMMNELCVLFNITFIIKFVESDEVKDFVASVSVPTGNRDNP